MPAYEGKRDGWSWPHYLLAGCGATALIVVIVLVGGVFAVRHIIQQALSIPPPHRTGPYNWGYWSQSATSTTTLPAGAGRLTYGHVFVSPHLAGGGERALRLKTSGRTEEWPLAYSAATQVRVGVYWHPAANGQGPFLRFVDPGNEQVLDLGRREVGNLHRLNARIYEVDYEYDNTTLCTSGVTQEFDGNGKLIRLTGPNGGPPTDLTQALESARCTYLGSIVRKGNKLVFVKSPGRSKP